MNKLLVGIALLLGAVALGASVLVLRQRDEINQLRAQVAASESALRPNPSTIQLEERARLAEEKVQELQTQLKESVAKTEAAIASAHPAASSRADPTTSSKPIADPNAPPSAAEAEFARLSSTHYNGKIQRQYGALFKQLNLSPETASALTQLLVDKKQAATDLAVATVKQGEDPTADTEDFGDLVSATKLDIEDRIKSLLGDSGYAAYKSYEHTTGRNNVITQLQQSLSNAGAPLTETQATQLDQTLQKNNISHLNQKVLNQSQSYLTPAQIQVLNTQMQEQKAAARLRKLPPPTVVAPPAPHS